MNTIGQRIKTRRIELGLSQEALAHKLGYKSRSAINKIELGINDITQSKVVDFANSLETTVPYLMGWDEDNPPAKVDEGIWKTICADENKFILATWIAELEGNDLAKVSSVLSAILEKQNPPTPKE